mgnify:FL=1
MGYVKSGIFVAIAIAVIYYSNFFHHLFTNPKVNPLFFEICVAAYTIIILLIFYISFILPTFFGVKDIEEYNPKLIPIGAVTGVIAVVSLLIAIWPVWGWTSLLIFLSLWKGFFGLSTFLPGGQFGNLLFLLINAGTIFSFYIIEHEGYFHWFIYHHHLYIFLTIFKLTKLNKISKRTHVSFDEN